MTDESVRLRPQHPAQRAGARRFLPFWAAARIGSSD